MPHTEERNLLCQFLDELGALRPGANGAYLTLQDVEELGEFVHVGLT
jgi:hypothetical protein